MSRRWLVAALAALALMVPSPALAAGGWSWPVGGDVTLRYGAPYPSTDGRTFTHGGLDISASAGAAVHACASGEVVFSGPVPAGEGARAWAVTVLTSDGLRVTYLPLSDARVSKGQSVEAGQQVGTLAGSGDASTVASHLHLGVKRGSASLDPLGFLSDRAPVAPPAHSAAPAAAPAAGTAPAPRVAPSPTTAPSHVTASANTPAHAGAGSTAGAPTAARAADPAAPLAGALAGSTRSLALAPPLTRAEAFASPASLNVSRAQADVIAGRDAVLAVAGRLGLLLLAVACVWPVLRAARKAGERAAPVPEPARGRHR